MRPRIYSSLALMLTALIAASACGRYGPPSRTGSSIARPAPNAAVTKPAQQGQPTDEGLTVDPDAECEVPEDEQP